MRKLFNVKTVLAVICLAGYGGSVNAQVFDWVVGMGSSSYDHGYAVAVDDAKNVYITGSFHDTATFPFGGGDTLVPTGNTDVFLAKFNPAGHLIWVKGFGGSNADAGLGVATDPATGDVILTGTIGAGIADFNPADTNGNITSAGSNDVFLARYDSSGNYIWAKSFGGSGAENVSSVTIDGGGNIYIAGDFKSATAYFNPGVAGSGELTISGSTKNADAYIAKYDGNGGFLWAHKIGGTGADYCGQTAVDASDNVYVIGWFASASAQFDASGTPASLLSTTGGYDVFLAKYDPSGSLMWTQKMGGKGPDHGMALAIDQLDKIYITGYFDSDTAQFDPAATGGAGQLILSADIDLYIAKYESNGDFIWAKSMEGNAKDHAQAIALDGAGNLYLTGTTGSSYVDFNPGINGGTVLNIATYCIFLAKYNTDGDFIFARGMGGTNGQDWGRGVAVDRSGNVYTAGYFSSHIAEFNRGGVGGILEGFDNNYDIFLLKLSCNDTSSHVLNMTVCETSYTLNDSVYTQPGSYVQQFANAGGCDSFVRLNLNFYQRTPTILPVEFTLYVREPFSSYQWIKNGTDIDGATDSFYVVTDNADYQVRVTEDPWACEFTSAVYTVNNVSVKDMDDIAAQISVYPNPASSMLYIKSPVPVNAQISSIDGRVVLMEQQATSVGIGHITPGIYLLRILDQDNRLLKTEKLVIE